eukprot:TRINITY_DN29703_c0_g1_i2.p1 TRINITY_DN29703_c0_g1~~TRINITY_DN29703_c0_g1_i2.p1  ORF type:complete len:589 (+),score=116.65 TRINITY_DN29703_c0_g1_i2:85-1851(+)
MSASGGYQVGKGNRKIARVSKEENDIATTWADRHRVAKQIVEETKFDLAVATVILINAIFIGIQQHFEMSGGSTVPFQIVESIFLTIYIAELWLRWTAYGKACLQESWVRMDIVLVALGVATAWILEPILHRFAPNNKDVSDNFGPLLVLRTFRLLRIAKFVRAFSRNRDAWVFLRGFRNCLPMVGFSFMGYSMVLYAFAVLGVELVGKNNTADNDDDFKAHADKYFGSLPKALLTLLRFCSLDNSSEVYTLLIERDPWLSIYFAALVLVLSLLMFHLLGAVIVSSTLDQNQVEYDEDKIKSEKTWNEVISGLRELFFRLDADMSGQLSAQELQSIHPRDMKHLKEALGGRDMTPLQVFASLDVDKSGEISIDEFFDGIRDLALSRADMDQKRMEKQVETIHWRLKEMFASQYETKLMIARLCQENGLAPLDGPLEMDDPFKAAGGRSLKLNTSGGSSGGFLRQVSAASVSAGRPLNGSDRMPGWACQLVEKLSEAWDSNLEQLNVALKGAASRGSQAQSTNVRKKALPASPSPPATNKKKAPATNEEHGKQSEQKDSEPEVELLYDSLEQPQTQDNLFGFGTKNIVV